MQEFFIGVIKMYREKEGQQMGWEFICIDELVPQDHLLRKIDKYIDFSFIYEKVKPFYCQDNGRPPIDPVMLFKMVFIGYLYGIRSERQLEAEVKGNIYYRWFLGLGLKDRVPDHSTLSLNRKRLQGTGIFQDIFDTIVELAIKHRMVGGRILFSDSTHVKANANKKKFSQQTVRVATKAYLQDLEQAIAEDREANGKKP
jgi:transposase